MTKLCYKRRNRDGTSHIFPQLFMMLIDHLVTSLESLRVSSNIDHKWGKKERE